MADDNPLQGLTLEEKIDKLKGLGPGGNSVLEELARADKGGELAAKVELWRKMRLRNLGWDVEEGKKPKGQSNQAFESLTNYLLKEAISRELARPQPGSAAPPTLKGEELHEVPGWSPQERLDKWSQELDASLGKPVETEDSGLPIIKFGGEEPGDLLQQVLDRTQKEMGDSTQPPPPAPPGPPGGPPGRGGSGSGRIGPPGGGNGGSGGPPGGDGGLPPPPGGNFPLMEPPIQTRLPDLSQLGSSGPRHPGESGTTDLLNTVGRGAGGLGKAISGSHPDVGAALGEVSELATDIPRALEGDPVAIARTAGKVAKVVEKKIDQFGEGVREHFGEAFEAMSSTKPAEVGKHVLGAAEGALKTLNAVGVPVDDTMIKFGKALLDGVDKLNKWNDNLHSGNIQFAEWSTSMAQVKAEQEMRDVLLSRERGERRGESAREQAETRHEVRRRESLLEDAWANDMNRVNAGLNNLRSLIFDRMAGGAPEAPKEEGNTLFDWMQETGSRTTWAEDYGRPARHGGR